MHDILMIDNGLSKWHSVLDESANQYDFTITNALSIEVGLEKLKDYPGSMDAVILGLSFTHGKMQGVEGLKKIK